MTEPPPEESLPTTADARAAATALSSLSTHLSADDPQPNIDREALGKAMSRLEGGEDKQQDGGEAGDGEREKKKVGAAVVRVEGADVALLVEELELSKSKATELLRGHEGDAVRAMRAFVTAAGA